MSATLDGIQVHAGSIREAVAARLNPPAAPPAELQPPAPVASPETPAQAAPAPEEQVAAADTTTQTQTDPPVQDEFELDLSKNPLDDAPPAEAIEPPATRKQWDVGFQDFIKTNPRGQRIWENHVEMSRLASLPEEGGLGFRPEVEQVKQWHQSHSTMDQMMNDFTSGDPGAAKNFVNFWFGKDANGRVLDGVSQIAESLPTMLADSNPEAYQKIGAHFGGEIVNHLTASIQGRSAEDAARIQDAIVVLTALTGIKTPSSPAAASPQSNSELEAARARIRELETGQIQQTQSQIKSTVQSSLARVIERDADAQLAPLKATHDPVVFEALKGKLISDLKQVVMSNPAVRGEVNKAMDRMAKSGNTGELNSVIRLWRQGYSNQIPEMGRKYRTAAGSALTAKSEESRTILQQANGKTAPGQGTAPGQSQPSAMLTRNPGENDTEFMRRTVTTRLAALRQ